MDQGWRMKLRQKSIYFDWLKESMVRVACAKWRDGCKSYRYLKFRFLI